MELKPCPMCGSEAHEAGTPDTDIVFCPSCDVTIVADIGGAGKIWNTRAYEAELTQLRADKAELVKLVNEQAEDESLWFLPQYVTEDCLQRALRKLHALVEDDKFVIAHLTKHEGKWGYALRVSLLSN